MKNKILKLFNVTSDQAERLACYSDNINEIADQVINETWWLS